MATWWARVYRGDGSELGVHEIDAPTFRQARNWASDLLVDAEAARSWTVHLHEDPDDEPLGRLEWGKDLLIHWKTGGPDRRR